MISIFMLVESRAKPRAIADGGETAAGRIGPEFTIGGEEGTDP
jgi:hypothetical protein